MRSDSAADILLLRLFCPARGGRARILAFLTSYETNMQRNVPRYETHMRRKVFWSSEQALPKLLAMLLVLSASLQALMLSVPLQAQEFGAAVAIGADEILIGEPLNQRRPSTINRNRQSADG